MLNFVILLVSILGASVTVNCRSVGEPVGFNSPVQTNYQDYGEQQEYVERPVRDVEDRPRKYGQAEYARNPRRRSDIEKSAPEAAYQSRNNGDDEDRRVAPSDHVAAAARELDDLNGKSDVAVDADVSDHRNEEGLRQAGNDIPQRDASNRQPRDNAEADPQEPARKNEDARPQVANAGYDAMNEPAKDDSAYGDYANYDYAPEQGRQGRVEDQQNLEQNVAPANGEAAPPPRYEQGN